MSATTALLPNSSSAAYPASSQEAFQAPLGAPEPSCFDRFLGNVTPLADPAALNLTCSAMYAGIAGTHYGQGQKVCGAVNTLVVACYQASRALSLAARSRRLRAAVDAAAKPEPTGTSTSLAICSGVAYGAYCLTRYVTIAEAAIIGTSAAASVVGLLSIVGEMHYSENTHVRHTLRWMLS